MTTVTIEHLARSVRHSDLFNARVSVETIAHILEIALETRIGMCALPPDSGNKCSIALGNGFDLVCEVKGHKK